MGPGQWSLPLRSRWGRLFQCQASLERALTEGRRQDVAQWQARPPAGRLWAPSLRGTRGHLLAGALASMLQFCEPRAFSTHGEASSLSSPALPRPLSPGHTLWPHVWLPPSSRSSGALRCGRHHALPGRGRPGCARPSLWSSLDGPAGLTDPLSQGTLSLSLSGAAALSWQRLGREPCPPGHLPPQRPPAVTCAVRARPPPTAPHHLLPATAAANVFPS